ncbi:hypothetical protein K505DRAFT_93511 [Melanomma pulvis-pyrius CBS 109.77]|uniref:Uncharacterized protein n=1 Tax=Melanomma pulvis-pyrius CBS 109.77 TaxID=1314802 RepID=A0A6A6X0N7_9PLEO|nr:hypothetical protein K505DRAFT_93511 [Melanomma pulvis-pyrius CBS 109.77]
MQFILDDSPVSPPVRCQSSERTKLGVAAAPSHFHRIQSRCPSKRASFSPSEQRRWVRTGTHCHRLPPASTNLHRWSASPLAMGENGGEGGRFGRWRRPRLCRGTPQSQPCVPIWRAHAGGVDWRVPAKSFPLCLSHNQQWIVVRPQEDYTRFPTQVIHVRPEHTSFSRCEPIPG